MPGSSEASETGEKHYREASRDSGKPMVDAAFGEVMVTCEKISWLIREGERWLKPEKRSSGVMVLSCLCMHHDESGTPQNMPYLLSFCLPALRLQRERLCVAIIIAALAPAWCILGSQPAHLMLMRRCSTNRLG